MAEVVVIGAGVGGLAAAARLAHAGHHVAICEQAAEVGGKLGTLQRDGFRFDTGPSLLTLPQVLRDTFAATGAPLEQSLPLTRLDPIARYRYADGTTFDASASLQELCARLDAALGAGSGADWRAVMERAGAIWEAVRRPFLESPLDGPLDLLRQAVRLRDLATIAPHRTLRDLGRRYLRDPRLRMLLERYATYTGSDPRRAPAALASVAYAEQRYGAWYVPGGLHRLAAALRDRALERGASLRLGTAVTEVELVAGRVSGVRLASGERLPAEVVVANADAAHLYHDLLPGPAGRAGRRALARVTPSLSGFAVLLAVERPPPGVAHHTVLFSGDYDAEFDALFGPRPQPVPDPTLYLSAPHDPSGAPPGCAAWFLLANAPRQGQVDWTPARTSAYADLLVDLLAARGLDVRDRIRFRTVLSPADLEQRTGAVGGAIYGSSSNGPRAAFLRPANRTPVPGLFLVGGSSHPGGGLPLVLLSAHITAGLIGPA